MSSDRLIYPNRRLGLDHAWFDFRARPDVPPFAWPGNAPVALWISIPIEVFPLTPPAHVRPLGTLEREYPDYWAYSNRDYGMRIGVFRLLNVLRKLGLPASAMINAAGVARYPDVVRTIKQEGLEVIAHGADMAQPISGRMSATNEERLVAESLRTLSDYFGIPIAGWHSPGHSTSERTLDCLANHGIQYTCDWANDEFPYVMRTEMGPLVSLPFSYELSDRLLLNHYALTTQDYADAVLAAFSALARDAADGRGRILALSLSPWLLGYPHRIRTLDEMLRSILGQGRAWPATGIDILRAWISQSRP